MAGELFESLSVSWPAKPVQIFATSGIYLGRGGGAGIHQRGEESGGGRGNRRWRLEGWWLVPDRAGERGGGRQGAPTVVLLHCFIYRRFGKMGSMGW